MQDGYRILESGKYGKMAKKYQHHKLPSCLGYPKHEGKDEENLTHFFGHYPNSFTLYQLQREEEISLNQVTDSVFIHYEGFAGGEKLCFLFRRIFSIRKNFSIFFFYRKAEKRNL